MKIKQQTNTFLKKEQIKALIEATILKEHNYKVDKTEFFIFYEDSNSRKISSDFSGVRCSIKVNSKTDTKIEVEDQVEIEIETIELLQLIGEYLTASGYEVVETPHCEFEDDYYEDSYSRNNKRFVGVKCITNKKEENINFDWRKNK